MDQENNSTDVMKAKFAELPEQVQKAITSANITIHLRELATKHQLHLDQWGALEREVRMTLLGIKDSGDLENSIRTGIGVSAETAAALADDISEIIFEPIREELERLLDHPDAQVKSETDVENMTAQMLSSQSQEQATAAAPLSSVIAPAPIAPLPTLPETKVARTAISAVYKPGEVSNDRKDVHNDPYRELPA